MKKKKYLALFMAMSMAVTAAPVTALADETDVQTIDEQDGSGNGQEGGGSQEGSGSQEGGGSQEGSGSQEGDSETTAINSFAALTAAIAAAEAGATITLGGNIEVTETATLDLDGKTIDTNGHAIIVEGDLTITGNGTMVNNVEATPEQGETPADRKTMIQVQESGTLTVENGTFKTVAAQIIYAAGKATIEDGTFTCTAETVSDALDGGAMLVAKGSKASLTFLKGELTATNIAGNNFVYGIYPANGATLVIGDENEGPTIKAASAVAMNNTTSNPHITITVNNGTIEAGNNVLDESNYTHFNNAFYLSGKSKVTINGGTFKATSNKTHIFSFPYKADAKLTINGGTFDASEGKDVFYSKAPNSQNDANSIDVKGGEFKYAEGKLTNFNENNTFDKFISGGTFAQPVAAADLATGRACVKVGDSEYAVAATADVTLNTTNATIYRGRQAELKAIVKVNGETYDVQDNVTWESNNTAVATVDNGVVSAIADGTATITASIPVTIAAAEQAPQTAEGIAAVGDTTIQATCAVTVKKKSSSSSSSSSGGGGGSTATTNKTTVSDTKNGAVTASSTKANAGDKVVLTPKADEGYVLDKITVKDKDGKEVTLTAEKDGTYSFTMPKGGVTVDTAFKQADGTENTGNTDKPAADTKTIKLQIGNKVVTVDDKAITNDVAPVIRNDRTLVPIRVITEALGGQVAWNEAAKEVTLTIDGKEIKMTIGKTLEKYGVAPEIIGDRTYVPVRFVADELGVTIAWDDATKTVTITTTK